MTPLTDAWATGTVAVGVAALPRPLAPPAGFTLAAAGMLAATMAGADRPAGVTALAVAVVVVAFAGAFRRWWPVAVLALAGGGLWAFAVARGADRLSGMTSGGSVAWIALAGGACLALGACEDGHEGAGRHRRRHPSMPALTLLVVPGLVIAMSAARVVRGGWVLAAPAGSAALVSIALGRSAAALGALAVSAAAAGFAPAAWLLGAGAAVAVGLGDSAGTAILGLPGAVVVAATVSRSGGLSRDSLALVAALGAVAAVGLVRGGQLPSLTDWRLSAPAAIGAWLLVGPGSWKWAGVQGLTAYDRGAAVAVSVAGLTVVGLALVERVRLVRAPR